VIPIETVCRIEIIKDGRDYVAKAHLDGGSIKVYRQQIFEGVLTEMTVDLLDSIEE
jgi:hypothetical protein